MHRVLVLGAGKIGSLVIRGGSMDLGYKQARGEVSHSSGAWRVARPRRANYKS